MGLVRPFTGRVVRPEWTSRLVRPLEGDAGLDSSFDLAAYGAAAADAAYLYRLPAGGRLRTAAVLGVGVAGFADGRVLGHEAIRPERVERLVEVFDATPFRSDLVSLIWPGLRLDVAAAADAGSNIQGLSPEATVALLEQLAGHRLYVADGHHRVAASVQRWERAGRPDVALACAVFTPDQVELHAFHRRVRGPVDADDLLARLATTYAVRPAAGPTQQHGVLGVYVGRRWWRAEPLAPQQLPGVAGLDVTRLDEDVLLPLLGLRRGDPRVEPVPEVRSVEDSERACDEDSGVLFTLASPTVEDLVDVAERGEAMSAKTTYVQPKPPIGAFLSDGF